jgi:hypothetical protein
MIVYTHDDVIKMMDTFHTSILNRDLCMAKLTPIELPQQETLYTEEQVREAMVKARLFKSSENADIIIQSLKQPKKH